MSLKRNADIEKDYLMDQQFAIYSTTRPYQFGLFENISDITYLHTSSVKALTYGSESMSENSGNRSFPMTESISSWAFLWASGQRDMARKKFSRAQTVCIDDQ